ncbi:MAG: carbohydrate ABC transporter substrate-binding protein, partial [Chloroflexi bacterium]|nr:carbohydrate ABC transporter substrate-binding protein [Chloroflexota bacterium]
MTLLRSHLARGRRTHPPDELSDTAVTQTEPSLRRWRTGGTHKKRSSLLRRDTVSKSKFSKFGLLLTLLVVVVLAAPSAIAQGPEYITYNSMHGDPIPRAFDQETVAMWNEANPLMPVEHSIIAHEDFKQAIRAYLTAEPAPDVLTWFAGERARFFIDKGLIADISDVFEEKGFNEAYAPGFVALASVEGKQYFLPTSYYWWAVYYVPSVFEKAGITQVPQTWDEFLGACDTLNAAGITP